MVKQYVTDEQEAEERELITSQSLKLFRELYLLATLPKELDNNPKFKRRVLAESKALEAIIANRENGRRCYYCHRTKAQVELGEETATRLTQCFDCAMGTHEKSFDLERRERERERAMNG